MTKLGNIIDKPSNMLALLELRKSVASFADQSRFVGENFKRLEPAFELAEDRELSNK